MIDISTNGTRVTKVRYTVLKEWDIEVTIEEETHTLNIKIVSEEDKQGEDTELVRMQVDDAISTVGEGEDVGEKLHNAIENWFSNNYEPYPVQYHGVESDNIFSAIWDYIEAKGLH